MESTELNEMESLLLNVERPIFTNQEKFDNNFQKNGPSEKKKGMLNLITDLLHFLSFIY
jgi:hypothetical protein